MCLASLILCCCLLVPPTRCQAQPLQQQEDNASGAGAVADPQDTLLPGAPKTTGPLVDSAPARPSLCQGTFEGCATQPMPRPDAVAACFGSAKVACPPNSYISKDGDVVVPMEETYAFCLPSCQKLYALDIKACVERQAANTKFKGSGMTPVQVYGRIQQQCRIYAAGGNTGFVDPNGAVSVLTAWESANATLARLFALTLVIFVIIIWDNQQPPF
ncbi:hypothetical protein CBR_g52282 [Chara braunii]|uniref:Uncharacterized protein n=1 Tax=Chara braunii TaxID=69332 RepID=A0A388MA51_CHABU|nr:hypothetical protein CBR_g52282 [Chara braunii]|eukprot:GBG91395.1 hypothetical protein CBR_g52282 [Chara braunii]